MMHAFQGMAPRLGGRVFIAPNAAIIGDVEIGDDASIWFNSIVRGDVNWIRIGPRSNIQDMCCLHVTNRKHALLIEEEVSVAHNVMLHGCTLRKGCLIGMSSTIMDGAEVGEGCLVAAGSLLREGFKAPPRTLVAGWPAVVKGDLSPERQEHFAAIWQRYVRYKEAYFADGWAMAVAPFVENPRPGFEDGHEWP
jgi:carbonic anhydrase/acetyltransferase-like protein (isoleucine patch superfamily)